MDTKSSKTSLAEGMSCLSRCSTDKSEFFFFLTAGLAFRLSLSDELLPAEDLSMLGILQGADECMHSMLQDGGKPLQTLLQRKIKLINLQMSVLSTLGQCQVQ